MWFGSRSRRGGSTSNTVGRYGTRNCRWGREYDPAPFVMPKSAVAWARSTEVHDTTIGWRFVNPKMNAAYGTDSMPETAQNLADEYGISRADQDIFALRSQERAAAAQASGRLAAEIVPVAVPRGRGNLAEFAHDEHVRMTTLQDLERLKPITRPDGSITAGNASGVNDGAAALIVATEAAASRPFRPWPAPAASRPSIFRLPA